jgi:hypothetical protein
MLIGGRMSIRKEVVGFERRFKSAGALNLFVKGD